MATIIVAVVGVFATMSDTRSFEVHLANCQSWQRHDDTKGRGEIGWSIEGWFSAGRMVFYRGSDAEKVAGFRRALLHWGADPETVKLSVLDMTK